MEQKVCKRCGGIMRYSSVKKMLECAFCGHTVASDEEDLDVCVESVDHLISWGRYKAAQSINDELLKREPENPRHYYNKMRCFYLTNSITDYVSANRKNPRKLEQIKDDPNWVPIYNGISDTKKTFVMLVRQFINQALEVNDTKQNTKDTFHREGDKPTGIQANNKTSTNPILSDISAFFAVNDDLFGIKYMPNKKMTYDSEYLGSRTVEEAQEIKEAKRRRDVLDSHLDNRIKDVRKVERVVWDDSEEADKIIESIFLIPKEKLCPECGGKLRYERSTGFMKCTECGWDEPLEKIETDFTIEDVDKMIVRHQFAAAKPKVIELQKTDKDNPQLIIRYILCSLHAVDLKELLKKNEADRVLGRPEWDQLAKIKPQETEEMLNLMKNFYDASDGSGDDILDKITAIADNL